MEYQVFMIINSLNEKYLILIIAYLSLLRSFTRVCQDKIIRRVIISLFGIYVYTLFFILLFLIFTYLAINSC